MNISDYFSKVLQAPLKNIQWSRGAENEKAAFLRSWMSEFDGRRAYVLSDRDDGSPGYGERIRHIKSIILGKAGYVVLLEPQDPTEEKWAIKHFEEKVYPIRCFEREADEWFAVLEVGVEISVASGFDPDLDLEKLMD